jgi:hypothetical protein
MPNFPSIRGGLVQLHQQIAALHDAILKDEATEVVVKVGFLRQIVAGVPVTPEQLAELKSLIAFADSLSVLDPVPAQPAVEQAPPVKKTRRKKK